MFKQRKRRLGTREVCSKVIGLDATLPIISLLTGGFGAPIHSLRLIFRSNK